jgi:phosphate/phosphite/phosphonate ABC transporter binding protein
MRVFTVGVVGLAAALAAAGARAAPAAAQEITFGMTRPIGARAAAGAAKAIPPYFTKAAGRPVKAKLFSDYLALSDALAQGAVDVAWATPVAFARATLFAKPAILGQAVRRGKTEYLSVLIAKKDGPVKALGDARGGRVAWVEKGSATGYVVPRAMLQSVLINPDLHFKEQLYFPDHEGVCRAIQDGRAEVGATFMDPRPAGEAPVADGCREALGSADGFEVMRVSDPVPNDVVAAREGLDPAVADALRQALLFMGDKPEGKKLLKDVFHAEGFAAGGAASFDKLRTMLPRELRVPPAAAEPAK